MSETAGLGRTKDSTEIAKVGIKGDNGGGSVRALTP